MKINPVSGAYALAALSLVMLLALFVWGVLELRAEIDATKDCEAQCLPKALDAVLDSQNNCHCAPRANECV